MAYQTLYRKYRPKSFDLLFGQDVIVKTLKNVIKNNKLSHAYLFTGPRGTGKTSSAKLFAKAINCLNNTSGDACNNCETCNSFNNNSNPDIIEIDAASNNGVDEIREIKNKVSLVPSMSKYKVYIIDEVHMLSIGAFNALLKTLEEPPNYVIFILATTEPQKIPATIISRCQRFDFKNIAPLKMKECLKNISEKENIKIEDDAIDEIILNSNGGMRDAIGLLDQAFAFSEENINKEDIQNLSGSVSKEDITTFINYILNSNIKELLNITEIWNENGKDYNLILQKIINTLGNIIIDIKLNKEINIKNISEEKIYLLFEYFNEMIIKLQTTNYKKIVFNIEILNIINKLNGEKNIIKENIVTTDKNNVSRETLNTTNEYEIEIENLKNIRINNIIKKSSKKEINFIKSLWNNLNEYLTEEEYKLCAGMLLEGTPVASSNEGIIITFPVVSSINRIEKIYDTSKKLIKEIYNNKYKLVFIEDDYWKKIRPDYIEKVKNNKLEIIDENEVLLKIKEMNNNETINEFDELIEMEE